MRSNRSRTGNTPDASAYPPNPHQPSDQGSTTQQPAAGASSYQSKRSVLTRNACLRCRLAKTKCNGKHPSCARCLACGAQCNYDVTSEGITKMQDLQQRLDAKTQELARALKIIEALQTRSDQDATEILARLRLGDSLQTTADSMDESSRANGTHSLSDTPAMFLGPANAYSTYRESDSLPMARRRHPVAAYPDGSMPSRSLAKMPQRASESFSSSTTPDYSDGRSPMDQAFFANGDTSPPQWGEADGRNVKTAPPRTSGSTTYESLDAHEQMARLYASKRSRTLE